MPTGIQAYPPLTPYTSGFRVLTPRPLDVYLGPWEDTVGSGGNSIGSTSAGVALVNSTISSGVRYVGQQVIIIANNGSGQTLAYKYWYRGGTADGNLEEFSSGGGGIVGDYVTTFNGRTGAVQGVSAALPGDGIAVSAATGSVTITNTGVTYISAGSFISMSANTGTVTISNIGVHSFNGNTGAVIGASLGANTFTGLNAFNAGVSASTVYVSSGSTFAGSVIFNGGLTASRIDATGNVSVGGTLDVYGNLYVQGTLTTVNESQLLIQDKYLVLGSNLNTSSLADGAGVYVGATVGANAFAGICYSDASTEWSSSHSFDIPSTSFYRVGGTNVLASTYLGSVVTGSSLASVGTLTNGVWNASVIGLAYGGTNKNLTSTGASGGIVFKDGTGLSVLSDTGTSGNILRSNGTNAAPSWTSPSTLTGVTATKIILSPGSANTDYLLTFVSDTGSYVSGMNLFVDNDAKITYNPFTNILTVTQIEAIVDGGTW